MGERYFDWAGLEVPYEVPRQRRRRDMIRTKARARRIFGAYLGDPTLWESREELEAHLDKCEHLADHLAHCSKPCCNKRRFWEGPTMQERRFYEELKKGH